MPSPFPGMNPWLEQAGVWHDFHERLIPAIAEAILPTLPEHYFTRIDERGRLPAIDFEREGFLEFIDRRDKQVVAAVEVLSPANKQSGRDRENYLDKRNLILASRAHFIEIDLRRNWGRMPGAHLLNCAYAVLLSRQEERPEVELWPVQLRDPLPMIPVPLRHDDPDGKLDLKAALDRVYDAAAYGRSIYEEEPEPPLAAKDAAWAKRIIAKSLGNV